MSHTEVGLKIDENVREDVAVLNVSGALMSGPEVSEFHEHIKRLAKDGIVKVVADFSKVKWFGSSMLGVMTASLTTLRNEGGDLRLTGITKKIESILMVTQLASIFRTIDSVDRAVASFKTQPPDPKQRD
jgi:anti-anti-sigma factor